jgi:hypothetical protein
MAKVLPYFASETFIHSFSPLPAPEERVETIIFTNYFFQIKKYTIVKYNSEYFKNISFVEILKFSKLINYLTDMC